MAGPEELKIQRVAGRPSGVAVRIDWLGWAAIVSMTVALLAIFILAPTERIQGDVQRIFYFHLSLAYLAYVSFVVVFFASILYLFKRDLNYDIWARTSAEIGVVFTTLVLATGMIWGRQVWGAFWSWDPKLTTTLILWFVYLVYLMMRRYAGSDHRGAAFGAVIGIVGAIDIPIIHFSVVWWRSLHPGPTFVTESGPAMPPTMIATMLFTILAFTLLYVYLMRTRLGIERLRDRLAALRAEMY